MRSFVGAVLVTSSIALAIPRSAHAQADGTPPLDDPVAVRLETARDDGRVRAALVLEVRRGWKLYSRESGDTGLPLVVQWHIPGGWRAGAERWPRPRRRWVAGLETRVYEGRVVIERELIPEAPTPGTVIARVEWAACADVCVRGTSHVSAALPLAQPAR